MMASFVAAVRYFRVVRPVPRLTRLSFAVITVACAVRLLAGHVDRGALLMPVLALQTFTVSTGFLTYARRGHFDILFTGGVGRVPVALVYWWLSALPGVLSWLALVAIDLLRHQSMLLMTGGTMVAMLCVSMVPWALTVNLSRFSGAIGWLLVLVMAVVLVPAPRAWTSWWSADLSAPWWVNGASLFLFPPRLVGVDIFVQWRVVLPVVLLAVVAMGVSVVWVWRSDLPLETGQ